MAHRFRNMSIQSKLICSTGVSLVAIILVWILIAKIITVSDQTFTQAKETLELSDAVSATTRSAQLISGPVGKLLYDWNVLMAQEGFKKNTQIYEEKLQALKTLLKDEKDTRIAKNSSITEEGVSRIFTLSEKIFLLADKKITAEGEGKMFAAQAAMEEASETMSEISTIDFEILETMTLTEKLLSERETLLFAESIKTNKMFSYISMIVLFMSVIITALVSFIIARSVSKPTKALQKAAKAVSEGILTYKMDIESYGEIGDLVNSFSTMVDSQRKLVTEVKNSSKQIASASNELYKSSQQMTSNSEEVERKAETVSEASAATNTNVQAVATASEEMMVTIKEISRNIQIESEITSKAVSLSKDNNRTISKLGESSQKVGEIVEVIREIANQTNLLALNATIEAARAGEAGKGFAVVAYEVKQLSQKISMKTEEISQTISGIQGDTQTAIVATEGISTVISKIDNISASVAGAIEEQSVVMEEISRNMAEAALGSKKVLESNSEVAQTSKNTAEGAENVLRASQSLSRMGSEFLALVDKFTV